MLASFFVAPPSDTAWAPNIAALSGSAPSTSVRPRAGPLKTPPVPREDLIGRKPHPHTPVNPDLHAARRTHQPTEPNPGASKIRLARAAIS